MEEFLAFVTIDVWTLIFTWGNLIILFLLMKKFLFKPINNILDKRKKEIDEMYESAQSSKGDAEKLLEDYTEKLKNVNEEAEDILKTAKKRAEGKSEEIVSEAKKEAQVILSRAEREIALEKSRAQEELLKEVSGLASTMASKILEKDISEEDHKEMIDKFISEIGDGDDK